ncbi:unnamed protein product [Lupinus luteus]|uniref:CLAVATA3/ESR (CLE)-related protein 25-like n=1 Tax=Lupinus luteus TaxID=3873 RepID=A0AAV1WSP1_LUPLU
MGTTSSSFFPKFLFRALAVVGLVCLLVVGSISASGRTRQEATQRSSKILEHEQVMGRDNKHANTEELDFNNMSKRRVPNGPDPIHNRKAGNAGRTPGKA